MIKRYTKPVMAAVWEEKAKFSLWVQSLLAVLYAFCKQGKISAEDLLEITENVDFTVNRVNKLDAKFNHDAGALIEACRETLRRKGLSEKQLVSFGKKITSYDMEDPAFSRMICNALELLIEAIDEAIEVLRNRAREFQSTECILLTHGQLATPGYLGLRMIRWMTMLERDRIRLRKCIETMNVGKFSGATGAYDELDPKIEKIACDHLRLDVADGTSQIIHRDRHAEVMSMITICACNIAQIANDLWHMCEYPRSEAREFFDISQRGSTAMPHKRNPITLERLRGLASVMRGFDLAALEQVVTFDERAIDQSSVERIIWPDATILLHYMLVTFTVTFGKMVFFPDKMSENLDNVHGIWGAQYIKNALWDKGVTKLWFRFPNGRRKKLPVYKWVQSCAFEYAWDAITNQPKEHLEDVVNKQGIRKYLTHREVERCFDLVYVLRNAQAIYKKHGI